MQLLEKLKIEKQATVDLLKMELEIVRSLTAKSLRLLASEDFADLTELDRHTDMVTYYRRRIGFLNEMMGQLAAYEVTDVEKLIGELAPKFSDLPHISQATPLQQLHVMWENFEGFRTELASLRQRIGEIALRHAADYPNISEVEPHEQLYAIDQSCQGISLANATCHQFIGTLGERLGMTKEETYEEFKKVAQEAVKELTR